MSLVVAVPSAIKVFNWTATMYKGSVSLDTPMLYAFGFIGLFTIGGLTGLFLATMAFDVHVTDTYFVIAHFHYVMVGGMVMAFMGGIHFWFPKITGRIYPENWGRRSRRDRLHWFQPYLLPAVHPRVSGNAAPLCKLCARISDAARHVLRRRLDPRHRLLDPDHLPHMGLAEWPVSSQNPWNAKGVEWDNRRLRRLPITSMFPPWLPNRPTTIREEQEVSLG